MNVEEGPGRPKVQEGQMYSPSTFGTSRVVYRAPRHAVRSSEQVDGTGRAQVVYALGDSDEANVTRGSERIGLVAPPATLAWGPDFTPKLLPTRAKERPPNT